MKKDNGMSMISLTLAMIIMILMSGIAINIGIQAYNYIKVQNFIAKLKVVQAKVDEVSEDDFDFSTLIKLVDIQSSDPDTYNKFVGIISNPIEHNINTAYSWDESLDTNLANYYYFTPDNLETKLGLKNQDIYVIVNFETRNVIAKKGVNRDGKFYYRQYDLPGAEQLIKN